MKQYRILFVLLALFVMATAACGGTVIGDPTNPVGSNFSSEGGTITVIVPEAYPIEEAYVDFNGIRINTSRVAAQVPGFNPALLIGDPMIAEVAGIKYYAIFAETDTVTLDINGAEINTPSESAQELLAMAANMGMFPVEGAAALSGALDFVKSSGWNFRFAIVYPGFDPAVDQLPWTAATQAAPVASTAVVATPAAAMLSPLGQELAAAQQPAQPTVPPPWKDLEITEDPFSPLPYESAGQAARRLGTQGYSSRCLQIYFEAVVEWDWTVAGRGSWEYWTTSYDIPLPTLCLDGN